MKVPYKTNSFPSFLTSSFLKRCFRGVCLALPLLLGAGDFSQPDLNAHRKKIEAMSATEREQLKNKYKTFQQLPIETQQELRNIYQHIEKNRRSGGRLARVVDNYREWLGTLSPWQREEIRKHKNPTARIRIIQELKANKKKNLNQYSPDAYNLLRLNKHARQQMQSMTLTLSDDDLEAVMQVIQKKADFSPSMVNEWKALPPARRYVNILIALLQKKGERKARFRWLGSQAITDLTEVIRDKDVKNEIQRIHNKETKRAIVDLLILKSILQQWQKTVRPSRPTEEQLANFYKSLSPDRREKLMEHSPENVKRRLSFEYRMKNDPAMREIMKLRKLMSGGKPFRKGPRGKRPHFRPDERGRGRRNRLKRLKDTKPRNDAKP
ncbi:hypothetical protein MNBD_PLANCTO02-2502 [hydrothermal vent metagenome]|uniref:DUF3106 domain-containing protein n=1 Tax=hydrothermal vent metagenome TaxID=652676 RepID=A0A3B1E0N1_9ZZZZ